MLPYRRNEMSQDGCGRYDEQTYILLLSLLAKFYQVTGKVFEQLFWI